MKSPYTLLFLVSILAVACLRHVTLPDEQRLEPCGVKLTIITHENAYPSEPLRIVLKHYLKEAGYVLVGEGALPKYELTVSALHYGKYVLVSCLIIEDLRLLAGEWQVVFDHPMDMQAFGRETIWDFDQATERRYEKVEPGNEGGYFPWHETIEPEVETPREVAWAAPLTSRR